jgi:large repetitive protein
MTTRPSIWRHLFAKFVTTTIIWLLSLTAVGLASSFTTTVPGTSIVIPTTYPQAGGIVIVLEGANGNVYYQFANPSTMFIGYQNSGSPAAFNGNPFQIAPAAALNCGISTCSSYLGGSISRVSIRFTAYDGDSQAGMFDFNDLTLRLNGIDVGNWSPVPTQNTNLAGTTVISSNTGFGNNTFDTGWFQSTNPTLLSSILVSGSLKSTVYDADPNDNYWDFKQGADADTSTVPLTVAPGFSIDKTASSTTYAAVGDVITYNYIVTNIGSVYIDNLTVSDDKIGAVACSPTIIYPVAGPTGISNCSKTYTVTQANIDAGSITNSATALGTPQAGSLGAVSDRLTITGPAATPAMVLTKTATPTPFGSVGSSIDYSFSIQNTGNVTLTDSSVTDPSLASLSCTSGPIEPGLTGTFTCTGNSHIITQADVDSGFIFNGASGSATAPSGTAITAGASVNTAGPAQVHAISIAKSASVSTYSEAGSLVTYSYVVTNTGNITLTSAITVADDRIPNVSCPALPVGGLAPNDTLTCSGIYTITQADLNFGSVTNTASATSGATATTADAVMNITAIQSPALKIDKRSVTTSFNTVGNIIPYSFLVTNSGNVTLSSPITVLDNKIAPVPGVSCPALPDAGATMDPGSSITCTGDYAATQADIDAGGVTNIAIAKSGGTTSPSDSYTIPAIQARTMSLAKTATSVAFSVPGDQVTYEYLITNTGNVTLTGPFTIADNRVAPANISCPSGNLAPAGQIICTGTYTVALDDLTLGSVTNVATAGNGVTSSSQTSATVPTGANPALSIEKTTVPAVSSFNIVGDVITYSYKVTNSGNATFTRQVDVVDDKIGTITCFTPAIGHLVFIAGEVTTCTANYVVTQEDLDAGYVTNQAFGQTTFGGLGPVGNIPVTSPPDAVTVSAGQAPHMTLIKTATNLPVSSVGQALTYAINIKNDGNVTLSFINISDPLIPTLSCTITSLAVGASDQSCRGIYIVRQSDIDTGVINNTALALGLTPQGATVAASGGLSTPITQDSAITIDKRITGNADEDTTGSVTLNDTITYAVSATNTGNISQTNVSVTDAKLTPPAITCATLAPTAVCTLSGTHSVTQAEADTGQIDNTGAATTTLIIAPVSKTISTPVSQNSSLSIAKVLTSTAPATLNSVLTYNVIVTNDGTITQSNVTVTDSKIMPGSMTCASLAPAATCILTGSHVVTQAELDAGQVDNVGSVTSTLLPVAETATLFTPVVQVSSLAIAKAVAANNDVDGSGTISLGDTLTYKVTASNDGSVSQSNVVVTDSKITPNSITCASLVPAEACVLSGTYTVTQSDVDHGSISNVGAVTSTLLPIPETVGLTTPATQNSSLSIVKTQTAISPFILGSTLTYEVMVTNDGNISQNNVVVSDANITPDTITCATLLPSERCVLSGSHVVAQGEVDSGKVDNSASVISTLLPTLEIVTVSTPVAQVSSLGIDKAQTANDDADGSGTISLNDTLTYVVTATNDGTVTQDNVVVTDNKITPNSVTCAVLAPAETCVLSGAYIVTQGDVDAGAIGNTGTVTSTLLPAAQSVNVNTSLIQTSSLSVLKSLASTGPFKLGDVLSYQVTATNNGNITQDDVVVTDSKITPNFITCASLAPAGTCVLNGTHTVTQSDVDAGTIDNTGAVVSALLPTAKTVTIATPVSQTSALSIAKTLVSTVPITVGSLLTYEVTASNDGTITQSNVIVTDSKITPNFITCVSVAPAETCILSGTYTATQADMDAGMIENTGAVTSALLPTPQTVSVVTPLLQNSSLSLTKTMTSTGIIETGSVLTYEVTVTNDGSLTQTNVVVSDNKITPNSYTCASLAPAEACVLSGSYTVTQGDVDAGTIDNTATVTSTLLPAPESTTITTAIPQVASLEATKIIERAGKGTGDSVTYQITVRNTGNITLNNVNLYDNLTRAGGSSLSLTTGPTYVSSDLGSHAGTLLPSETATYQASYSLVSADISAGGILNSATAHGTPSPTILNPLPLPVSDVSDNGIDTDGNTVNDPTRLLLDPSGVIYSSATGLPLSGVTLLLISTSGTPLPATCLLPGQQGQITGASGEYRFDIVTGGAPACPVGEAEYRISFTAPSGYLNAISMVYPPEVGSIDASSCSIDAIPGGLCQISASATAPPAGTTFPYYLSFLFAAGDADVVNNHIPLDPVPVLTAGKLTVKKTASVRLAHRGDVVTYTITVRNRTLTAVGPLDVVDTLPATITYQTGSATLDGAAALPDVSGRRVTFAGITVPPRSQKVIELSVRIGINASPGDYINQAVAENPATGAALSNIAKASVRIEFEHIFDCGDVIGKVFDDKNSSGYQDTGESGLPGVRLATVKGTLITTDRNGQFHVPCPELPDTKIGSNFLLKLDARTLPDGYSVTTENPRSVRLTAGKVTKLNFGAAPPKTIKIDVDARVFDKNDKVSYELSHDLGSILHRLADRPLRLRITYRSTNMVGDIAANRVTKLEAMARQEWGLISSQPLTVVTRVVVSK